MRADRFINNHLDSFLHTFSPASFITIHDKYLFVSMHTDRFISIFIINLRFHPCCNPLNYNLCISIHITFPCWVLRCWGWRHAWLVVWWLARSYRQTRHPWCWKPQITSCHWRAGWMRSRRTDNNTSIAKLVARNASCLLLNQCACACIGPRWNGDHHPQPWDARQLYRLFHEFVSGVIDSSRYFGPDMLHLDMSTVGFAASYTLHSQVRKIAFHMLWSWCYWWIRYYFVGSIGYVIYTCDDPFLVVKCFVYYIVSGVNKSLTF